MRRSRRANGSEGWLFPPPVSETVKGHGRIDIRTIVITTGLNDYVHKSLKFPHVAQIGIVTRERTVLATMKKSIEKAYVITSRSPCTASPRQFAQFVREHWHIENSLHWVKDVVLDEDHSRIRTGTAPLAMAILRSFAVSMVNLSCHRGNVARGLRHLSRHPDEAIALLAA